MFSINWLQRRRTVAAVCVGVIASVSIALIIASHRASETRLAPYRLRTELSPRDGYAWVQLGKAYAAEKRFHDAEKAFKKAISLGETLALHDLGRFYRENGRLAEAALCFEQAQSYKAAGDVYAALGDQARARKAYEKASPTPSVIPTPEQKQFTAKEIEDALYPPKPPPNTGYRGEFFRVLEPLPRIQSGLPPKAPFQVTVPNDGFHYWIKLRRADSKSAQYLFVRSGETAAIDIDLGNYTLTYAVGKTWRGDLWRFGSETRYFKCDADFQFYEQENHVYGHTVELYPQPNGNLATKSIDPSEF